MRYAVIGSRASLRHRGIDYVSAGGFVDEIQLADGLCHQSFCGRHQCYHWHAEEQPLKREAGLHSMSQESKPSVSDSFRLVSSFHLRVHLVSGGWYAWIP